MYNITIIHIQILLIIMLKSIYFKICKIIYAYGYVVSIYKIHNTKLICNYMYIFYTINGGYIT